MLALKPRGGAEEPPEPAEVEGLVTRLLDDVAAETGTDDYEFNVFGFLDSFAIAADPRFLEGLLSRPEIESATANRPGPEAPSG